MPEPFKKARAFQKKTKPFKKNQAFQEARDSVRRERATCGSVL